MRKLFILLTTLATGLLAACSSENGPTDNGPIKFDDPQDVNQEYYADVTNNSISFTAEGSWTASVSTTSKASDNAWVDINPKSGGSGPNTLTITLQTNTTGEDRSATITISCLGQQTTFTITQSASTESGVTPGVYYQVNGSSEWVNKLDPNTPITSLKVETRGGALLTEEIVQQFADLSLTQLDMSNAIYESHTFPRPQDDPFETISFATLEAVTLPVNVTAIGGWTFSHSPLTEINLQQIDSIGRSAFMDCAQLTSVTLSSSLHTLSESTFANTGLEEITLPKSLTLIPAFAFQGSALKTVTIPESTDTLCLGVSSFEACQYLRNLNIGNREVHLQRCAFMGCVDLREVDLSPVTEIGDGAFSGCNLLNSVELTGALTIGSTAFKDCSSLKTLTFGDQLSMIGDGAFGGCSALENIILPTSLEVIGQAAFSGCAMTWIEIPENVREIGSHPFENCDKLRNVTFKTDKLVRIPSYFLNGNLNISSIELPESVEEIGSHAFFACENLQQITLGKNVKSIGQYALAHCYHLYSFTCQATTPPTCFDTEVFTNTGITTQGDNIPNVLYIPTGTLSAYENDPAWSTLTRSYEFHELDMTSAQ